MPQKVFIRRNWSCLAYDTIDLPSIF